jgi:hypothetical protein
MICRPAGRRDFFCIQIIRHNNNKKNQPGEEKTGLISQTVSAIDRFKNESFEIYALYFSYPNFLKLLFRFIGPYY